MTPRKASSKASAKSGPAPSSFAFTEDWELRVGHPAAVVAGVDEVGRGCLAGPVVAGAVVLPERIDPIAHPWLCEVNDSKLLSAEVRERLAPLIREWVRAFAIAEASVEEIDRINIYHASHLAMQRALEGLRLNVAHVLVDGNQVPKNLLCPGSAIVKGDSRALSIACASILAKVHRDFQMREFEERFPGYGFASHKGYSTPTHFRALKEKGACEIHRRSFAPVAEALGLKPTIEPEADAQLELDEALRVE